MKEKEDLGKSTMRKHHLHNLNNPPFGFPDETVLIFVGKVLKRTLLGLGNKKGREDTGQHEECEYFQTKREVKIKSQ